LASAGHPGGPTPEEANQVELRQNFRTVPVRPIVFALATIAVVGLILLAWLGLQSGTRPAASIAPVQTSVSGPDAQERNAQFLQARGQQQSAAETTHGH
jgi:hypothetical protein